MTTTTEEIDDEEPTTPERKPKSGGMKSPPAENPHHCPICGTQGKYCGRQHQSEKFVLIAWNDCDCGNTWGYTFSHDKLPDPTTLL